MIRRRHALIFILLLLPLARIVHAQGKRWSGTAEVSASLFQGNTDQRALFSRGELGRADSTVQVRASLSVGYADAARDTLPRQVTKRTWLGVMSLDYQPFARFSPFAFLTYEASFEKRILDRLGIGAGGKLVLLRQEGTEASISLAVLAERLRPTRLSPDSNTVSTARWSWRGRVRHQIDDRVRFAHTTFFQPRMDDLAAYTVNSSSELSFAVRQSTSLTISHLTLYDSSARARGALSNNDAQLLLGVRTAF